MAGRNTVLLVEAEPSLLRVNMRVLEREGYYVLPARNLREARELINGVTLHAAVLDVELLDGSGFDFCRELRGTKNIPVVFLTALQGTEYEQAGYDAGAGDYITKPYRIERLIESLRAALKEGLTCEE